VALKPLQRQENQLPPRKIGEGGTPHQWLTDAAIAYQEGGINAAGNALTGLDMIPVVAEPAANAVMTTVEGSEIAVQLRDRYNSE